MNEKLKALKLAMEAQESKTFEKTDWDKVTFKADLGETRVRILANPNPEELFFLGDSYHVMSKTHYQDCNGSDCPVCKMLKVVWSDEDSIRQGAYRQLKKKARYTYQILLLNEDGSIKDTTPKLFQMAKTLHNFVLEQAFEDVAILDMDLIIKKEKGNPYFTYENSYFVEGEDLDLTDIKLNPLDMGRKYTYEKSMETVRKYDRQFDLGLDFGEKSEVKKEVVVDTNNSDLDEFELQLMKEIDE